MAICFATRGGAEVPYLQFYPAHKLMIVDGLWAVAGTTNFERLSFEYQDEINVGVRDAAFARDWAGST